MTLEQIVSWVIIGGIAGLLADLVTPWLKLRLLEAIMVGILGALGGAWLLEVLAIVPPAGMVGTDLTAFAGALVLLLMVAIMKRWRHGSPFFQRNRVWSFVQPFEE
ncbi:MAG: GlsB/YeaQ/YmgE family stress response membrane protein [Chloroflexi bacterium]|nr:GlsB/YeaQ/YmgE family stress response membrane protein [Chloroflexota bacterium]